MKALRTDQSRLLIYVALLVLIAVGGTIARLLYGKELQSAEDALFGATPFGRFLHSAILAALAGVWLYTVVRRERRRQPDKSVPLVRWQIVAMSIAILAACVGGLLWVRYG